MKKVSILFSILFLFCSSFSTQASIAAQSKRDNKVSVLFVQTAPSAKIKSMGETNKFLKITLDKVNSKVIYFSNRPKRVYGKLEAEKFTVMWESYFKKNPPNVAIQTSYQTRGDKMKEFTLIGTLTNPVYDSKAHSMTYTIQLEKGQQVTRHQLGQTTLFFDDVPFNPGGF
ncbi:MAG: hypothetical protein HYX60_00845 [Legionella longbeachae]|nr:hypothetical protein [Legionella longbeachae]